jgi:hypothetical protein
MLQDPQPPEKWENTNPLPVTCVYFTNSCPATAVQREDQLIVEDIEEDREVIEVRRCRLHSRHYSPAEEIINYCLSKKIFPRHKMLLC